MRNSPAKASKAKPAARTAVKPSVKDTSKSRTAAEAGKAAAKPKRVAKANQPKTAAAKSTPVKKTAATKPAAKPAPKAVSAKQAIAKKAVTAKKVQKPVKPAKAAAAGTKAKPAAASSAKVKPQPKRSAAKPVAKAAAKPVKVAPAKSVAKAAATPPKAKAVSKPAPAAAKKAVKPAAKAAPEVARGAKRVPAAGARTAKPLAQRGPVKPLPPVKAEPVVFRPPVVQPKAPKMAEVLKSLDAAMKFFQKGNFSAAEDAFEKIVAKYPTQSDIVALVSRYIAICKSKLQAPAKVSQTPDSLYDQGVIEMNNGHFEAAIDFFRRALKSQSDMPHVLYSLAAAQVRVGEIDDGLRTLEQAVAAREIHRSKARTDPDFQPLRGDARFQELVGLGAI